ncbi:MAG: DUF4357 domain-containing protein [Aerococcus suis]|nr:DUF4357 domain-containing protein [Aerococcus suis]
MVNITLDLKNGDAYFGRAEIRGKKIIVKKGSKCRSFTESFAKEVESRSRIKNIHKKGINKTDRSLIQDETFDSVTPAAEIVSGTSVNGWKMWKNKDGEAIDIYIVTIRRVNQELIMTQNNKGISCVTTCHE